MAPLTEQRIPVTLSTVIFSLKKMAENRLMKIGLLAMITAARAAEIVFKPLKKK